MTLLRINQLNSIEEADLTVAEQKKCYGGFAALDNMITNHPKDNKRREVAFQSYANGDTDIIEVTPALIIMEHKDGGKGIVSIV